MTLNDLMAKYGSDKAAHGFCEFYESFFRPVREQVQSVLEIGVADGASIRAWLDYFPNARIFGLDAWDGAVGKYGDRSSWPSSSRFMPFVGDQAKRSQLEILVEKQGPWDIVIDDGGHTMEQQQVSLGVLFPHTRMFYVVEDLHTSFMDEITLYNPNGPNRSYPSGAKDRDTTHRLLEFFNQRAYINGTDFMLPEEESYFVDHAKRPIHIFDRDGDHKHMTSVLEVK